MNAPWLAPQRKPQALTAADIRGEIIWLVRGLRVWRGEEGTETELLALHMGHPQYPHRAGRRKGKYDRMEYRVAQ